MMDVPDFQSFFVPLLELASDGKEHTIREAKDYAIKKLKIVADALLEKVPSGRQTKVDNRISWAKSYFVQSQILSSPRRGTFIITERGQALFNQKLKKITIKTLNQYPEFLEFHSVKKETAQNHTVEHVDYIQTPEELLQNAYQEIRTNLANELLETIKGNSPAFFENLIVDLMLCLGYGGSREDAGKSIGKSGDEGIDGIIKEDRLGLDVIYLQAKKWEGTVGRPDVQRFVGALHGKRARKGVFITTGKFSDDAIKYVETIDPKVILIDGKALVNYMIDFNLGTAPSQKFEIKRIDSDYFVEE